MRLTRLMLIAGVFGASVLAGRFATTAAAEEASPCGAFDGPVCHRATKCVNLIFWNHCWEEDVDYYAGGAGGGAGGGGGGGF